MKSNVFWRGAPLGTCPSVPGANKQNKYRLCPRGDGLQQCRTTSAASLKTGEQEGKDSNSQWPKPPNICNQLPMQNEQEKSWPIYHQVAWRFLCFSFCVHFFILGKGSGLVIVNKPEIGDLFFFFLKKNQPWAWSDDTFVSLKTAWKYYALS